MESYLDSNKYDKEVRRIAGNASNIAVRHFDPNIQQHIQGLAQPVRDRLNRFMTANNMIPPFGIVESYVIKFEVRKLVFEKHVDSICSYVGAGWIREHVEEYNLLVPTVIEALICNYCIPNEERDS